MGISTIILATGTMQPNDNLDGWTITSETATVKNEEDIELRRGDRISANGDVSRRGHIIARVDLRVGDWSNPAAAARTLGSRGGKANTPAQAAARAENGKHPPRPGSRPRGRPRKPAITSGKSAPAPTARSPRPPRR
jgi:hypothetical protein